MNVSLAQRRMLVFRGNVRGIQKRLKHLRHAAKAAGRIHEWRTDALRELTDKFLKAVDDELARLNKMLAKGEA